MTPVAPLTAPKAHVRDKETVDSEGRASRPGSAVSRIHPPAADRGNVPARPQGTVPRKAMVDQNVIAPAGSSTTGTDKLLQALADTGEVLSGRSDGGPDDHAGRKPACDGGIGPNAADMGGDRARLGERSPLPLMAIGQNEIPGGAPIPCAGKTHVSKTDRGQGQPDQRSAETRAELTDGSSGKGVAPAERPQAQRTDEPAFRLTLPDEEADALGQAYASAGVVLEYGSGGSTFLALRSGAGFVMSVESDKAWAKRIDAALAAEFAADRFLVHHADIGPTGPWGRPEGSRGYRRFHLYATGIWDHPGFRHPDVVLIDGRFRVACFLATMIRCTRPVTVLFDDYIDRTNYHWIEEMVPRDDLIGRMARFTIRPTSLPPGQLTRVAGAFTDPR